MKRAVALWLALPALAAAHPIPQEVSVKPDFSSVQGLDAARALAAEGKLVAVLLFPAEFGGEEIPQNITYVTPEAAAARERIIGTMTGMIEKGTINKMEVVPTYKGRSFVPSAITMKAWHSSKPGRFEPTIEIW